MKKKGIQKNYRILWGIFLILAWSGVAVLFFKMNGDISVEKLLQHQPKNKALAVLVMTGLFLLKSVDFIIHSGILYAADGVMFPLPAAIALNLLESVVMVMPTYFIGKSLGEPALSAIGERYPKIRAFAQIPEKSEFAIALLLRVVGLPITAAGLYMGAAGFRIKDYLLGSLIGLLPFILTYTVMGVGARDLKAPAFWIAVGIEFVISMSALALSLRTLRRNRK